MAAQAQEMLMTARTQTASAISSKAYFYPPLGIVYFARHSSLWPPLLHRIVPCTLLSIAILIPMFLLTYFPQAAILTILNGPMGPINAIALVLSESTVLFNMLARSFILQGALVDVFDAALVCEGMNGLVGRGRELKGGSRADGAKRLGRMLIKPLNKFSPKHLVEYLILLPVNLIPIVGTPLFLILQGRNSGPSFHERYFALKQFSPEQKEGFVKEHKGAYISFGTANMALSLIPFASIFFLFSSTVGAALWAAEIERGGVNVPGEKVEFDSKKKQ